MKKTNFHLRYSNTWQTTIVVMSIVTISVGLSLWFFWRSLYLPELKNHARYLATELSLVDSLKSDWDNETQRKQGLLDKMHTIFIDNPNKFPTVEEKIVAGFFTDIIEQEVKTQLGRPVTVFFKFKPTAQLWIQDSKHPEYWIREPVIYYSNYNPFLLAIFLLGIPILTLLTILLLARQLNRPLRILQRAATNYIKKGHATNLTTQQGSIEIQQVNTAFNKLFSTLSQTQKERTIMLAGISHDLRTPLTRMRLTAEMLDDEFLREGLIYDIEDMDAILEQFISFMKDGSDEPVKPVDLNEIFKEIMVQFAPTRFINNAKQLPNLPLRPLSIKRMIINLVNNAIRYGEQPIYLNAEILQNNHLNKEQQLTENVEPDIQPHQKMPTNKAEETLMICVRDCGQGVEEQHLQRITQPFERGESARTTQGSGLGLAIVNRIANLHHGHVVVSNHPESGLQVCVYIPLLSKVIEKPKNK